MQEMRPYGMDIITFMRRHFMCPRCHHNFPMCDALADLLTNPTKVKDGVLLVLRSNGLIPSGDTVTTVWRPLATHAHIKRIGNKLVEDLMADFERPDP